MDDERTNSREKIEEVVERIMGELEPLKEASPAEEVRRLVGYMVDEIGRVEYAPSTGSKRTAQNLKKRFDALIEALAGTDDIHIEGRIKLGHRHRILSDPDHYDDQRVYRVNGWLHLDRRDLLVLLKHVQRELDRYDKPPSRLTWFKKRCAKAACQFVAMFHDRKPSTFEGGPVRVIAELIYEFYTGDDRADIMKRACDLAVRNWRAPIIVLGEGPPRRLAPGEDLPVLPFGPSEWSPGDDE